MKKFKVVTLGCRTNQYESGAYSTQLKKMGFLAATEEEKAEICIVNTCTVTESADRSSKKMIKELIKENPESRIVITGCLLEISEEKRNEIAGLSKNIQLVRNLGKEELVKQIFPEAEQYPEFSIKIFDAHTRAFVKVQDGCNSFCTYCVIPYVRGRSRSRSIQEILLEVQGLIKNGYKEVVLTGINIGDFDGGGGKRLVDLVREVDNIEGLERLRISSIDPDEVDEELAKVILEGKKTCPSMHVVLQSGSNVVLKRMNRKYTRQIFFDCVERLKARHPDFTFTTDIIVGFPGETENDFADTIQAVQRVEFAKVHMFPYSDRPRTRAASYPNKVDPQVIKQRKTELLHCSERMAFQLRNKFLGRKMAVLLEESGGSDYISGHTENFLKVLIPKENFKPNEIVEVHLLENSPEGFLGRILP